MTIESSRKQISSLKPRTRELLAQARQLIERPEDARLSALAIPLLNKAIKTDPKFPQLHAELARVQQRQGLIEDARTSIQIAVSLSPQSIALKLHECMLEIPNFYENTSDIDECREIYRIKLQCLLDTVRSTNKQSLASAAPAIGHATPFFLPFQNKNDRQLQAAYGEIVCRIMAAAHGGMERGLTGIRTKTPRIRLGIVSAHVRRHSIWRVMLRGWLSQIDPARFDVSVYSLTTMEDEQTELARASCSRLVSGVKSTAEWCSIIRQNQPDVLFYPEVGVDAQTVQLAALRLSPIQAASWGHSTTSGLPSMDYFLSGDLIEPEDADEHYTENLIRLPSFSFHYEPENIAADSIPREDFGLRPETTVFFCAQALWKYLPEHDDLYPKIAKKLQSSQDFQFVFMQHKKLARITDQFRLRLERSFNDHDIDFHRHVVFLPPLSHGAYQRLGQLADIMLDSVGYGGWTTLLDSLKHDLPIVTTPGRFMRGRFAMAALTRMGVSELIATDYKSYIDIAADIAKDAKRRALLTERISRNKHLIYAETTCIDGLEDFLATPGKFERRRAEKWNLQPDG